MINASDRRQAVELITEAVDAGAALYKACAELGKYSMVRAKHQ